MKALLNLLREHKAGAATGIYSVCSSHALVIEAAMREARRSGQYADLPPQKPVKTFISHRKENVISLRPR